MKIAVASDRKLQVEQIRLIFGGKESIHNCDSIFQELVSVNGLLGDDKLVTEYGTRAHNCFLRQHNSSLEIFPVICDKKILKNTENILHQGQMRVASGRQDLGTRPPRRFRSLMARERTRVQWGGFLSVLFFRKIKT